MPGLRDACVESAREGDTVGDWRGHCVQSDVAGAGGGSDFERQLPGVKATFPEYPWMSQLQQKRTFTVTGLNDCFRVCPCLL
jgi:hypothetical protein